MDASHLLRLGLPAAISTIIFFIPPAPAQTPTVAWARTADGWASGFEIAVTERIDAQGNIYAIGVRNYTEWVTFKLDSNGNTIWQARVPFARNDQYSWPYAMALDSLGNVVVAGSTTGESSGADFTIIKYDTLGNFQWLRRYDGLAHGEDIANAVAIDSEGNVIVCGNSAGVGTGIDTATVKYSPDGTQLWVARYDGPVHANDRALSIAVDNLDRAILVGYSGGGLTGDDVLIVAYAPDGAVSFEKRYNGPEGLDDYGQSVAVSPTNDIYFTGSTMTNAGGLDLLTVKLSPTGETLWERSYDGPPHYGDFGNRVRIDLSGRVVVCGSSRGSSNQSQVVTIQYDSNGTERWAKRHEENLLAYDEFRDMSVDGAGNVLVVCKAPTYLNGDLVTVKYDMDGTLQWVAQYDGPAHGDDGPRGVVTDVAGNVYVLGSSIGREASTWGDQNFDMVIVKYDPAGVIVADWRKDVISGSGWDDVATLATGPDGAVCVSGQWESPERNYDAMTICYDRDGYERWRANFDGPAAKGDTAMRVCIATSGNVYVLAISEGESTGFDMATIKYDSNGNEKWVRRYDGAVHMDDYPYSLFVDPVENVTVSGLSRVSTQHRYEIVTIEYNSDGTVAWENHDGGPNNNAEGYAHTVDADGNVIVAGAAWVTNQSFDFYTAKYSPGGTAIWSKTAGGTGYNSDIALAVAMDSQRNILVTGYSDAPPLAKDVTTLKYSPDGDELWRRSLSTPKNEIPIGVAVGPDDSVIVGYGYEPPTGSTIYGAIKYDAAGTLQWNRQIVPAGASQSYETTMRVDSKGNTYLGGYSFISPVAKAIVIRLNPAGLVDWQLEYPGPSGLGGYCYALDLDSSGNVLLGGIDYPRGGDYLTAKVLNCVVRADTNGSGMPNGADVQSFINCVLTASGDCACADSNADGVINLSDVEGFVATLLSQSVPQPTS